MRRKALILLCAAVPAAPTLAAVPPSARPVMDAYALEAAPVVDGDVLGDSAWSGVTPASGFWQVQPEEGQPASQRTEVYIGFSGSNLYVGVVAYDDDPDSIIVNDSRRDTSLDDSDAFLFIIDGLLDRQNGFIFGTNPAGIEYDGQVIKDGAGTGQRFGQGGVNLSWDTTWQVRARITEYGWSAEFEIPFRSLRFGRGASQDWGINFQRNIRRNNEIAYWSPLDRSRNLYRVSEAGTIRGVVPPPSRNLQITPYGRGDVRRGGDIDGTETDTEFGIDLKYSITPSLTLDATYNTDFAQVEVDEQQVNLDRFNLFFPEKRPFFLENAGQFSVGRPQEVELFFSRRIGISDDGEVIPVDGGMRLSGKIGPSTNVGLLHMQTEAISGVAPENKFTVARISQELPNRSSIGAIFTDRQGDGSYLLPKAEDRNRAYALDGRWGIGDNFTLSGWLARTDTPGLDDNDTGFGVQAAYASADWRIDSHYTEIEANFNPELGFLSRTDYRKFETIILRNVRNEGWQRVLQLRPHFAYRGYWKPDGFQETGLLHFHVPVDFRSGAEIGPAINFTRAGVTEDFEIVDGVIVEAGTYDHTELAVGAGSDDSQPLSYGINATIGGRFGGDRVSLAPFIEYRHGETFRTSLTFNYNDFDLPGGEFTAHLARLRLSYSFSPKIQLQALIQYNELADTIGTNIRFSWLRSANSGLFLVYNEIDERAVGALPTGREFILKYSHIFDVLD
jgi:hypothetical protein